jgi:hypothetical protein
MNDVSHSRREAAFVEGDIAYLARLETKPYRYVGASPPGVPIEVGDREFRTMRIGNGWPLAESFTLDDAGFAIDALPTTFDAFEDLDAVRSRYYPEMEARVVRKTGAARAVAFDHNVRHAPRGSAGGAIGKPSRLAHNDYTDTSAPQRVRDLLGASAEDVLRGRYAFINLWRPLLEPLRDAPLAVCDARSVAAGDLVASDLIYPDRRGEVYQVFHNPEHRWYFFPEMSRNDLLFIKCFDSMVDGRARCSAHTAFDDPTTPPGSPERYSIEVRTLVMW